MGGIGSGRRPKQITLDEMLTFSEWQQGSADIIKPAIFAKLDWLTIVYDHCSTREILRSLLTDIVDDTELDRVYGSRLMHSYGYITDLFINLNGVNIAYHMNEVNDLFHYMDLESVDSFSFFDQKFNYIRVDISGSGLDYIRSLGIDLDKHFKDPEYLGGHQYGYDLTYHLTRVDTAFDLINYHPDFLDRQIEICRKCGNPDTLRIGIAGKGGGIAYSIREGDQKTLYLGTGRSDRVLRIYDKLLQFRKSGMLGSCPYNVSTSDGTVLVPASWIRIELQCRRPEATHEIMFGSKNFLDVFMFVKKHFSLRNEENCADASWIELFDWDVCHSIIQNTKLVTFVSRIERAENWVMNAAWSNLMTLVCHYGWEWLIDRCNKRLLHLQSSHDPIDQKRYSAFFSRIVDNQLNLPPHCISDMGILRVI